MRRRTRSVLTCFFFVRDRVLPAVKCPPSYKAVLLFLASFANPDGTSVFQSSRSIAGRLGYDRNTVRQAIHYWIEAKVLGLVRAGNGRGHANEYRILLETAESFTPYSVKNGGTVHPFNEKRGDLTTNKGANSPAETGEKTGEPITPTESPNKNTEITNHHPPPKKADDDRIQRLFDQAERLLLAQGEDPFFVLVALEFLDKRSFECGKSPPATVQWYLTAYSNLKHDSQEVAAVWEQVKHRRKLREKYMPGFTGLPDNDAARQEFNRRIVSAARPP
jgi:hypothetical protein